MVHQKIAKVLLMLGFYFTDQGFRADISFFRLEHDRRAVGIVRADIDALMAAHALKSDPDVSLDMLQ